MLANVLQVLVFAGASLVSDSEHATALVAHWPMEGVEDGVLADASAQGHAGTFAGNEPPGVVRGIAGNALELDANAEVYFTISNSDAFHLPDGLTAMAWIKPARRSGTYEILCVKGDKSGDPPWPGWRFRYFWSRMSFEFGTTDNRQVRVSSAEWTVRAGFWSHVAVAYDGTTVRVYVNAVLVTEEPVEGTIARRKGPLILANYVGRKNAYAFDGTLDEVKVFSGCLTQNEIFAEATSKSR